MDRELINQIYLQAWLELPIPVGIYHRSGRTFAINKVAVELMGIPEAQIRDLRRTYNVREDPVLVRSGLSPQIERAFQGEDVVLPPLAYNPGEGLGHGVPDHTIYMRLRLRPLHGPWELGEYVSAHYERMEEQQYLEQQINEQRAQLEEAEALQQQLASELEATSTPVVPILKGVLIMPLVGGITAERAERIITALLEAVTHFQAEVVLLDIGGVPVVDTHVANYLLQATRALQLLGAQAMIVGISPEIAQTMVQLGLDLSAIATRADLQSGLEAALHRLGFEIAPIRR